MRHHLILAALAMLPVQALAQEGGRAPSIDQVPDSEAMLEGTPEAAAPDGFSIDISATFASQYVSDGIEYSDGPVIQPYIEFGYLGFYLGIWASTADEELLGSDTEVDYYIGYRGEAGAFYYDVSYAYYSYPGASEFNSDEWVFVGGVGLADQFFPNIGLSYAPETEVLTAEAGIDYFTPIEGLSLSANYGNVSNGGYNFWSAGGSYAFNENLAGTISWQNTNITKGLFVVELTTSFNLR
jgi:uncharacterized protein (TIGR02001 family)